MEIPQTPPHYSGQKYSKCAVTPGCWANLTANYCEKVLSLSLHLSYPLVNLLSSLIRHKAIHFFFFFLRLVNWINSTRAEKSFVASKRGGQHDNPAKTVQKMGKRKRTFISRSHQFFAPVRSAQFILPYQTFSLTCWCFSTCIDRLTLPSPKKSGMFAARWVHLSKLDNPSEPCTSASVAQWLLPPPVSLLLRVKILWIPQTAVSNL